MIASFFAADKKNRLQIIRLQLIALRKSVNRCTNFLNSNHNPMAKNVFKDCFAPKMFPRTDL